jgi:hypothetical protein
VVAVEVIVVLLAAPATARVGAAVGASTVLLGRHVARKGCCWLP